MPNTPDVTAKLAHYIFATRWEDVLANVRHQAKRSFMNFFAVALAGCGGSANPARTVRTAATHTLSLTEVARQEESQAARGNSRKYMVETKDGAAMGWKPLPGRRLLQCSKPTS